MLRATPILLGAALCVAGLLAAATAARADVEVEVRNGAKVTGTLLPADEVEDLSVELPAGALLTAVAKGKKSKGSKVAPVVTLQVLDDTDTDLAAGQVVAKGTGASIKKLAIPASGTYRVRVQGTTADPGTYLAKVKWKSPKKVVRDLDLSTGMATVDFAVDASAQVSFKVKGAKQTATLPRLVQVDSLAQGGGVIHMFAAPDPAATSQKAKKIPHPATASYRVTVNDASGAGGGAAKLTISIKAPKGKKAKVDITDSKIGPGPIGGGSVKGAVIGTGGGSLTIPPGDPSGIGGASLVIPAGALPGATSMLVGTAPPIPGTVLPAQDPAGPTVFFGPDGQQFAQDVTVTIPFLAAAFEGDFTTLRVVQRESDGTETVVEVSDYVIDELAGTVSIPAAHFTSFRVFGPEIELILGDLDGDGAAELFVPSVNALAGEGAVAQFASLPEPGYTDITTADVILQADAAGAAAADGLGGALASHDVSADGLVDLVAGAPGGDGGLLIFLGGANPGSTRTQDLAIVGTAGEGFGRSVALGDFDGDGLIDIAGGADGANGAGAIHVFLGSAGLQATDTDDSNRAIIGQLAGSLQGASLAAGDVTGDGLDDLIVPIPRIDSPAGGGGIVQVYAGSDQVNGGLSVSPVATFSAVGIADEFGSSVDVGDVNGDGVADVVVGSSNAIVGQERPGAVFVFFGGPGLGDATASQADVTLSGVEDREEFGAAVRVVDFDDDGTGDVAVGMPGQTEPDDQLADAGLTVLFYGSTNFADATRDGAALTLVSFGLENGRAGERILPAFDHDGDGAADLAVASPGVTGDGRDGLLLVYRGGDTRQIGSLLPSAIVFGEAGTFPID